MTREQIEIYQKYKKFGFNRRKLKQIRLGLKNGLTLDEIRIYARIGFEPKQMQEIRLLLEYNLTAEQKLTEDQINFATNPDLKDYEMRLIRLCYENNVPQNELNNLLDKGFNEKQIWEIANGLENGLSLDEVKIYANLELDEYQMKQIRLGLEHKLPLEQINLMIKPKVNSMKNFYYALTNKKVSNFNSDKMEQIRLLLEYNLTAEPKLTEEQINFIINLDSYKIQFIRLCCEKDIEQNEIKILLNKEFGNGGFFQINEGLENGLTINEIKSYADEKYGASQMEQIRLGLEHGLSLEKIKIIANPVFDSWQMCQIRLGLEHGLPIDKVKIYAKPEIKAVYAAMWNSHRNDMRDLRLKIEKEHMQQMALDKLFEEKEMQNSQECGKSLDDEIKELEKEQKPLNIIEIDENQSLDNLIANTPADESIDKNTDNGPSFDDE